MDREEHVPGVSIACALRVKGVSGVGDVWEGWNAERNWGQAGQSGEQRELCCRGGTGNIGMQMVFDCLTSQLSIPVFHAFCCSCVCGYIIPRAP